MEKEFLDVDLAKRMHNIGYDEECFAYYVFNSIKNDFIFIPSTVFIESPLKFSEGSTIPTPLYRQALRWFRNKHKLSGLIHEAIRKPTYWAVVYKHGNTEYRDTFEEAERDMIKKMIEIVENQYNTKIT